MFEYDKELLGNAQNLRKHMTDEEKHLWYDFLSKLPVPVKRQKNIERYILDFYIPQAKLGIEVDGSQHNAPEHAQADSERDAGLATLGIKVLRVRNVDVNKHFALVAQHILDVIRERGVES